MLRFRQCCVLDNAAFAFLCFQTNPPCTLTQDTSRHPICLTIVFRFACSIIFAPKVCIEWHKDLVWLRKPRPSARQLCPCEIEEEVGANAFVEQIYSSAAVIVEKID